jgi:RNA-binding protein
MPSGPLRRTLRAAGHHLAPVVQVGNQGVTDAVVAALDAQLTAHELVKVKVGGESPEDRFEAAERLGQGAGAAVAQILGRTVLVYRKHPERPRFEPRDTPVEPPAPRAAKAARTPRARRAPSAPAQRRGGKGARPQRGAPDARGSGRGGADRKPRGGRPPPRKRR